MSSALELIRWMFDGIHAVKRSASADDAGDAHSWYAGRRLCGQPDAPGGAEGSGEGEGKRLFVCAECGHDIHSGHSVYFMLDKRFCSNRCRLTRYARDDDGHPTHQGPPPPSPSPPPPLEQPTRAHAV